MLKKSITYTDWNGTERTEDFYFNLNRVEVYELEFGVEPGSTLTDSITSLIESKDLGRILSVIKQIILKAYGEKSPDGKRFMKSADISKSFEENPAFEELYMSMVSDSTAAAEFLTGIMPSAVRENLGPDPTKALVDKMNEVKDTNKIEQH